MSATEQPNSPLTSDTSRITKPVTEGHEGGSTGTYSSLPLATPPLAPGAPEESPEARVGSLPTELRYRPLRVHAQGGLGEVLIAEDAELHREVALKRIQARHSENAEHRRRFILEAEITAHLEHPGVVPVHGFGIDSHGQPCYAMRFVRGESLQAAIGRYHKEEDSAAKDPVERSLTFRQLLNRFVAVCNTIAYAHSRGILHRDLKPLNIMLGKYGETVVVDWGLARKVERDDSARQTGEESIAIYAAGDVEATRLGAVLGSPSYMSPEQAAGRWNTVGPASDIFALGATLYAILVGKAPYHGIDSLDLAQRRDFPPPRAVNKQVPRALEAICLKAMALRPEDRYATCLDLANDIEHWLADEPVGAYAEPWSMRLRRWARRHRTSVTSGAVAVLLILAGLLGALFLWNSSEQRRLRLLHEHRLDLERSAEADEKLGIAELQAGRFGSAENVFHQAASHLETDDALAGVRQRLATREQRAHRLAEFYRLSHLAERLITHDVDQAGDAAFDAALKALAIFDHENWWEHLPAADLTATQLESLRGDVHLQLLLAGAVRARAGLVNASNARAAAEGYRAGLRALEAAQRYRYTYSAYLGEVWCRAGLGELRGMPVKGAPELSGPADYFLVGILNFWVAQLPSDPISRFVLGRSALVNVLDFKTPLETAERHLRMSATLQPQHYWTFYWLGETLSAAGKHEAAELAYGVCIGLHPEDPTGYDKRAYELLRQSDEAKDAGRREQLFARSMTDMDAAVRAGRSWTPYYLRGTVYARQGDQARAIADFTEAIACGPEVEGLDPHFYACYAGRGRAYCSTGQYASAVADYTEALRLYPHQRAGARFSPAFCYEGRANAYLGQGAYDPAIADYTEAIRLAPQPVRYAYPVDLRSAYQCRGIAFAELGQWQKAESDLAKARDLEPKRLDIWPVRALVCLRKGDLAGYRQACAQGLATLPKTPTPQAAQRMAWICALAPDAVTDMRVPLALAEKAAAGPVPGDAPTTLGALLYRAGQCQRAAQHLSGALSSVQGTAKPLHYLFLAMAQARLGRPGDAREWLDKAARFSDEAATPSTAAASSALAAWERRLELKLLSQEARTLVENVRP